MATIVGPDGHAPLLDIEAPWHIWNENEIWKQGAPGLNHFVARVNDWVCDPLTDTIWIVDHVDEVSYYPTLRLIRQNGAAANIDDDQLVFGVGAGSDVMRLFVNKMTVPATCGVDGYVYSRGTLSNYAKVWLGTDTSPTTGQVISRMYDNSGNFISENIPLEQASLDSHTNFTTKVCKRFKTNHNLENGERVTLAFYADDGQLVHRVQLLVEITDTIIDLNLGIKYIDSISLETPFLSTTEANQIDFPLNITMASLNMMGVVHYTDGSTMRLPVNGTKFAMLGLEDRLSSIIGQPHDLVLRYTLASTERAVSPDGANNDFLVRPYRIVTTNPNESLSVKLYGFPYWEGPTFGYRMKFYLLNEARDVYFECTDKVLFSENTGPYDPKLYGYLQRKNLSVNLRSVSPSFISFVHTQSMDISLLHEMNSYTDQADWTIGVEANDQMPRFGPGVYANRIDLNSVTLKAECKNLDEWLETYYYAVQPLVRYLEETTAPKPTHFIVTLGADETEWSIDNWDKPLNIATQINLGVTLTIRFIRREVAGDLQMAVIAVPVKYVAIAP